MSPFQLEYLRFKEDHIGEPYIADVTDVRKGEERSALEERTE
jgi:hypothetical protein